MKTLTGGWKMMNMAKLGTVLGAAPLPGVIEIERKNNKMRLSPYTLCEKDRSGTWNGSRYGFALYITPLARGNLFTDLPAAQSCSASTTATNSQIVPLPFYLSACRNSLRDAAYSLFSAENNYSGFAALFLLGLPAAEMGGCHV